MNTADSHVSSNGLRAGILLILALVMLATRLHHFGSLPDASWAVFFAGGFYLSTNGAGGGGLLKATLARWGFVVLMALAVLVDYFVIRSQGLNFWTHYCVSPAYWFLLPSYAALWLGGTWLRRRISGTHLRDLAPLVGSAIVATSVCYLLSNGSFYWLSPIVAEPTVGGWMKNLGDWYLPYLSTTLLYVGIATVLHAATLLAARSLHTGAIQGEAQGGR